MEFRSSSFPLLATALLLLAGCQGARYEPKGEGEYFGYSSQNLSTRRFAVMFEGDPVTGLAQARDYALLRAAELTLEEGGTHFRVLAERSRIKRRVDTEVTPVHSDRLPERAGPPQGSQLLVRREYPVAWFDVEIYTAAQPASPDQIEVYDAAEIQATLVKRYHLTPRDRSQVDPQPR